MDREKIFELYERLYFHEAEVREKLLGRLQVPLAILLGGVSAFVYFTNGLPISESGPWVSVFIVFFVISIFCFFKSGYFFVRAYWGHTYEFIPSAMETEKYRLTLIETYKAYESSEELVSRHFENYLYNCYAECSSANTKTNDLRSHYLHKCNKFLVFLIFPLFISFVTFTFSGIGKEEGTNDMSVTISNPIRLQGSDSPLENIGSISTEELQVRTVEPPVETDNVKQIESATTTSSSSTETNP